MSSEKKQKISRATMTRFPVYLKALRVMGHEGKENFLSSELAEVTHIRIRLFVVTLAFCLRRIHLVKEAMVMIQKR